MRKRKAFTIIECVAAMAITAVTMLLVSFAITNLKQFNQRSLDSAVDWYVFLNELEMEEHHFIIDKVTKYHLFLKEGPNGEIYELQGRDVFYLSKFPGGGYLPLFEGIRGDHYYFRRLGKSRVLIAVQRTSGQELSGIVKFYEK